MKQKGFTQRMLDIAIKLLTQYSNTADDLSACYLCFYEDRDWCERHCSNTTVKNRPDEKCFARYIFLRARKELTEEVNKEKEVDYFGF